MRRMRPLWLAAALLFAACGYRLAHPGGGLAGDAGVCAPLMENLTAEPAAETWFTEALRSQLLRVGALGAPGSCGAQLVGTLVSLSTEVGMVDARGRLTSYRSRARLRLELRRDGAEVRRVEVAGSEESLTGLDVLQSEVAREAAFRRLAEQLTRDAVERL